MKGQPRTVSELGESALIERISRAIGAAGEGETWGGDDAAVVRSPGERVVFTTDVLVEGVDFDFAYCLGADVGWKAMAVNVSDIAAMGARGSVALAGLCLPPETLVSVVDGLTQGLLEAAATWGVRLVGGDVSRAEQISLYVALIGAAEKEPVHRSGASAGEAICVTGALGGAAGGLIALRRGLAGPGPTEGHPFPPPLADALTRLAARQLRPQARLEEGLRLASLGVTSMIDVSDGLALDLARLASAAGLGCRIDPDAVPVDPDLEALAGAVSDEQIDPLALALAGGEDFELLFTLPEGALNAAVDGLARLDTRVTRIGSMTDSGLKLGDDDLDPWKEVAWDHLLGR